MLLASQEKKEYSSESLEFRCQQSCPSPEDRTTVVTDEGQEVWCRDSASVKSRGHIEPRLTQLLTGGTLLPQFRELHRELVGGKPARNQVRESGSRVCVRVSQLMSRRKQMLIR